MYSKNLKNVDILTSLPLRAESMSGYSFLRKFTAH